MCYLQSNLKKKFGWQTRTSVLLFAYFLITIGYSFSSGFYSLFSFFVLFLVLIFLILFFLRWDIFLLGFPNILEFSSILLLIFVMLSFLLYGGIYQVKGAEFYLSQFLLGVAFLFSALYLFDVPRILRLNFLLLFLIAVTVRILVVFSSPEPIIDVYHITKIAPTVLLNGINPYSYKGYPELYRSISSNNYGYLPVSFLFFLPFVSIFHDPRAALILAEIAFFIILYFILRHSGFAREYKLDQIIPLLFLYNPRFSFITEQSWIDILPILFISLFVVALIFWRNWLIPALFFGLALASKTYYLLPMSLFLVRVKNHGLKLAAGSLVFFFFFLMPFYFWSPKDFVHSTILYPLSFQSLRLDLIHQSLTLNSFVFRYFHFDLPFFLILIILAAFYLLIFLRQERGLDSFLRASFIWFFIFFFLNREAFINYYYFVGNLALLTVSVELLGKA